MGDAPTAILFDSEGNELAREDGTSIDSATSALLIAGKDGSTMRFIRVDDNGRPIFVGAGTAGTPTGGVVSVQGVSGGEAIPVTLERNEFGSLIKFEANTNEELRSDDISLGDLYHGRAVDGTATSVASWEVIRFYRTTSGLITRVRYKSGISWDNRASAGNWL